MFLLSTNFLFIFIVTHSWESFVCNLLNIATSTYRHCFSSRFWTGKHAIVYESSLCRIWTNGILGVYKPMFELRMRLYNALTSFIKFSGNALIVLVSIDRIDAAFHYSDVFNRIWANWLLTIMVDVVISSISALLSVLTLVELRSIS